MIPETLLQVCVCVSNEGMWKSLRLVYFCILQPVDAFLIAGVKSQGTGGAIPTFLAGARSSSFFQSLAYSKVFGGSTWKAKGGTALSMTTTSSDDVEENDDGSTKEANVGQADIGRDSAPQERPDVDDVGTMKSWRNYLEISNARSRKIRGSNYVQLATIDSKSNEPRCRTVVFRGFLGLPEDHSMFHTSTEIVDGTTSHHKLPCIMKMCTDQRSEKVHQVGAAELVWWFPNTSEQYRIRGEMILIGSANQDRDDDRHLMIVRKEMWGSLTDASRESFLTPHRPGASTYDNAATTTTDPTHRLGGRDHDGKVIQPPPDTFLLMLLLPQRCDYLNLKNMYRQIDTVVDGTWQSQRVHP
jgi:pyridoxamine 5'-phosphate oxidase